MCGVFMAEEDSKEFLEAIKKYGDCPQDIFKLAKNEYQVAVAVELFKNEKEHAITNTKLTNIEKLLYLLLTATSVIGFGMLFEKLVTLLAV